MSYQDYIRLPCKKCGVINWKVSNLYNKAGHKRHPLTCRSCGYVSPICVPLKIVEAHYQSINKEIQYEERPDDSPICEKCGDKGAELHHWAPRHLFEDADMWPMSYLCQKCHKEWHGVVTPNMSRKVDYT